MLTAISLFLKRNKMELDEIKFYFNKCADDIDRTNMYMLRRTCMWTAIVYVGMLVFAMTIVPRFRMGAGHFLFIPLIIAYFFVNLYTRTHELFPTSVCNFACLFYYFNIGISLILMELSAEAFQPSRWFPLFLITFPILFIDRQYRYVAEETVMLFIYYVVTFFFKEPSYFYRDVYTVLAAYVISLIVSKVVLGTRAKQGLSMVELRRFSKMDKLTQVYNKGAFLSEMQEYLTRRREGAPCTMCIIDVDNFKLVNDSLGHEGGDLLLEQIGQLLIANFRPSDIVGRFGGDEFVVFMPNMRDPNLVDLRCRTLQMLLSDYYIGNTEPFTLSIGTIVDEGNHSQEELFGIADDALYESKMKGKNCCTSWVAHDQMSFDKPVLVFVTTLGEEKARLLPQEEKDRFQIYATQSEDEALLYVSQYRDNIGLIVAELNEETKSGELVIRYTKTRDRFSNIPILAVVRNEEVEKIARSLGADDVLVTSAPGEAFKDSITELSGK